VVVKKSATKLVISTTVAATKEEKSTPMVTLVKKFHQVHVLKRTAIAVNYVTMSETTKHYADVNKVTDWLKTRRHAPTALENVLPYTCQCVVLMVRPTSTRAT